jgi:hypothetical protein
MLVASFFILDKLYHIARFATGKAVVGACFGVYFAAWGIIIVEGAFDVVVFIGLYAVMRQQFQDRKPLFDIVYFHYKIFLSF